MKNREQVRSVVADWVARCAHVASASGQRESFRKVKWRQIQHMDQLECEIEREISEVVLQPTEPLIHETLDALSETAVEQPTDDKDEASEEEDGATRTGLEEQVSSIHSSVSVRHLDTGNRNVYLPKQRPCQREGSSVTLCSSSSGELLVVFGGRFLMDMRLFRYSAVYHPGRVQTVFSNDTFCFSLAENKWLLVQCSGSSPPGRSDHIGVFVHPDLLVVFGGRGRNGQVFNDIFVLQVCQWEWVKIEQSHNGKHESIRERYWHAACLNPQGMIVFGGRTDTCIYGDTIIVEDCFSSCVSVKDDPIPIQWTYAITVGRPPTPRCGMSVVSLDNDRIAVVGGWSMNENVATCEELEVFLLDTITWVWTSPRLSTVITSIDPPRARYLFQCFLINGTLCLFGGYHTPSSIAESSVPVTDNQLYQLHLQPRIWSRCPLRLRGLSHFMGDATVATSYFTLAISDTEPSLLEPIEISFSS